MFECQVDNGSIAQQSEHKNEQIYESKEGDGNPMRTRIFIFNIVISTLSCI